MIGLDNIGVFQFYPLKTKFEKQCGWQYVPMHMNFDLKQQDLQHVAWLVVGVHVADYKEYTPYLSVIKHVSVRLILLVAVKNWLGIIDVDIVIELYTAPCDTNIWSCCDTEFGPRCGVAVVLKCSLYGLKTASNFFHNYFGEFLRELGFPPSR